MDKRLKKGLIIGLSVIVVLIIGVLLANIVIKNKLKDAINNISETIKIQYHDIHVNALTGSVGLTHPKILVYGKTTKKINVEIELNELSITNISYWGYIFNDKITIKNISINEPKAIYNHNELVNLKSSENSFKDSFQKDIEIETIEIINGNVEIFNVANDSLILKSEKINFKIHDVAIKKSNLNRKIPVTFQDYQLTCNNLFYMLNDYENLVVGEGDFNNDFYKIKNLSIKTKYSKKVLSKQISVERDHFDLDIDSIVVKKHDFGIRKDSIFYFESNQVDFYQPIFKIYRDKLVEDDLTYKPLYSKSLRNLNFDMTLSNVFLNNASIIYTEKVKEETEGGRLEFSNLHAEIKDLSNTYEQNNNKTAVNIDAIFMENTPIHVNWNFDVKDKNDEFIFKADIGTMAASHMNQFMEPNANLRLNGEIKKTYFTINGNDQASLIDLKLEYDNFDIVILKQNGKEKNKLLSGLINLFVSSDSNDKSTAFRHGHKSNIERDKTKSVFNYLWLNVKSGLLNAMTGDGEKIEHN